MNPLQVHLIALLHELAHGPELGIDYGHFSEPEAGLLPTLDTLEAAQTAVPVAPDRPPLAAFVAHLSQLLTFTAGQLNGSVEFPDFAAPWQIKAVGEAEWSALRHELRETFILMQSAIQRRELEPEELNVAQSALTHLAYHAGALRFHIQNLRSQR
ncbi:hypothetical protein [Deinococcus sp.]|uniref:hypothetical protein n=1 Tax=Deinococcus sp. TaxID=47478 RepID=UPI003C7A632D